MGIFSSSSSNSGKPRRSSPQRHKQILNKLQDRCEALDKLDKKVKDLENKVKDPTNSLTRAQLELQEVKLLSLSGQRDEILAEISSIKRSIEESNKKNLSLVEAKNLRQN